MDWRLGVGDVVWEPLGSRSKAERVRIRSAAELRVRMLAARRDPQVSRYETSRDSVHGHGVEWVAVRDFARADALVHTMFITALPRYYQPPHGSDCPSTDIAREGLGHSQVTLSRRSR